MLKDLTLRRKQKLQVMREVFFISVIVCCEVSPCNLGEMYFKGWGVEQSFVEARKLYQKSADMNHSRAQYCRGRMMIEGEGGDEKFIRGLGFVEKAAKQGWEEAKSYLKKTKTWLKGLE